VVDGHIFLPFSNKYSVQCCHHYWETFEFLSLAAGATRCGDSVDWRCYAKGTTHDVRLLTERRTTPEVRSLGQGAVQYQQWKCGHLVGAR